MSLSSKEDQIQQRGRGGGISDHSSSRSRNRHRNNRKGSSTAAPLNDGEGEEELVGGVTEDCRTAKHKALESTRLGSYDAYVPECQPDGRYQPTQCFKVSSDRCRAILFIQNNCTEGQWISPLICGSGVQDKRYPGGSIHLACWQKKNKTSKTWFYKLPAAIFPIFISKK